MAVARHPSFVFYINLYSKDYYSIIKTILFLLEQAIEDSIELRVFANNGLYDLAICTDDNLCWETIDSISLAYIILGTTRVVDMKPWQPMLSNGSLPLFLSLVAVDTQDFELAFIIE